MMYARIANRPLIAAWTDVPWSALFDDTETVKTGSKQQTEYYENEAPPAWLGPEVGKVIDSPLISELHRVGNSVLGLYADGRLVFDNEVAHSVATELQASLSQGVLKVLTPIRSQYRKHHLCAHFRLGNNETGDWQNKEWRHVSSPAALMNNTLASMIKFVNKEVKKSGGDSGGDVSDDISVFLASDSPIVREWFEINVPKNWAVVKGVEIELPKNGVWFGEQKSKTSADLTQEEKNEKMAEAAADIFALGECSALFIPTYSSFTVTSITLSRAGGVPVFFRKEADFFTEEELRQS
jgi:hypothetical protein